MRGLLALAVGVVVACAPDAEDARPRDTTRPTYDAETGRLQRLTHDSDGNGVVDTWTYMDGPRTLRSELDRDEDGKIDRWEYYDDTGQVQRVGLSRANDGKADMWAYPGADGEIARAELASSPDRRVDRWEWFVDGVLVRAEEDGDGDGAVDKWEVHRDGSVVSVAFDENGDGSPDRRLNYGAGGALLSIETDPDGSGRFRKKGQVRQQPR